MLWTLDVLRMSWDPATDAPLFTTEDAANTRILIEDERDEGPYFSLWTMFAKPPIMRMSKISESNEYTENTENVIFPLPGASNPMWQGDWEVHSCDHSALLSVFAKRVMDFYGVDRAVKKQDGSPLVLTFIDRREKRQLREKFEYVAELQRAYPGIEISMVEFAPKPMVEQLSIIRNTDILIGVHGAGLTHALFLSPGSAAVEILPADFYHKGFRNLAHLLGHRYFSSHAVSNGTKGDWQQDDISFDEDSFMRMVGAAVVSMSNRGLRNDDVA